MINQILLFDIDNTLFNTSKFKKITFDKLTSILGGKEQELNRLAQKYMATLNSSTDFNIYKYIQLIAKKLKVRKKVLEDVLIKRGSIYQECLFPEVIKVLRVLSKHYTLGIFSEGHRKFQYNKLVKSNIIKYFDAKFIFIKRRKLKSITASFMDSGYVFIDDKLNVLEKIKNKNCIWINRKNQENNSTIKTIHNLNELIILFNKNTDNI